MEYFSKIKYIFTCILCISCIPLQEHILYIKILNLGIQNQVVRDTFATFLLGSNALFSLPTSLNAPSGLPSNSCSSVIIFTILSQVEHERGG